MVDPAPSDVLLRVPARPAYARVVRVGAAALGLRLGMSFGEIDDLRLAIDEAMIVLLDGVDGDGSADIEVTFGMTNGRLELEATRTDGGPDDEPVSEAAVHRFDAIAGSLVDDYEIDVAEASLRLRKTPARDDS